MLPRPAIKKRQVEVADVEADQGIDAAHLAARRFPELAQQLRLIRVAEDGEIVRLQVEHSDGDNSPRERVECRALDEVAAMIRLGLGNLLRDLRGIFQIARFNFRRIERWE